MEDKNGRRIFLDLGAHVGETIKAVLDPKYGFDKVICFEPAENCWNILAGFKDPRVQIEKFGLWNKTENLPLYNPGEIGSSIFEEKQATQDMKISKFVKASDWFRENLAKDDIVYMKINVEGAECDILDDLIDSGEISKIKSSLIMFDVKKIPSQQHREAETKDRLSKEKISYMTSEEVAKGFTHVARIQLWLDRIGAGSGIKLSFGEKIKSFLIKIFYVAGPNFAKSVKDLIFPKRGENNRN